MYILPALPPVEKDESRSEAEERFVVLSSTDIPVLILRFLNSNVKNETSDFTPS